MIMIINNIIILNLSSCTMLPPWRRLVGDQKESLGTIVEEFVEPCIWQGERRTMTADSDEDAGCRGEVVWNVGLPVVLVGLSDRNIFSDDFSEAMDVLMRRGIR